MKTIEVKLYQFAELSEEAQEKAVNSWLNAGIYDFWFESVYEDAENINLKITSFDIDHQQIGGDFVQGAHETAKSIIVEHGEMCETFKTAQKFLDAWDNLVYKHSDKVNTEKVSEENEYDFDNEASDLEQDFRNSLLEDYLILLRKEYEYQTSFEAIKETIEANEYDFLEDGTIH